MERILEKNLLIDDICEYNDYILAFQETETIKMFYNLLIEMRDDDSNYNFSSILELIDKIIIETTNYSATISVTREFEWTLMRFVIDNLEKTKIKIFNSIFNPDICISINNLHISDFNCDFNCDYDYNNDYANIFI